MSVDFLVHPRWREVPFTASGHAYDWLDIFLAAMWRGDWTSFDHELRAGLSYQIAGVDPRGRPLSASEFAAAADRFRYDRRLVASDDVIAWLEATGLTTEAWSDYLHRSLLRERWRVHEESLPPGSLTPADIASIDVTAEGICAGAFDRFALTLGGRVAVVAAGGLDCSFDPDYDAIGRALRDHATWLAPLPIGDVRARLVRMAHVEHAFQLHADAAITPDALSRQVEQHRLAWTRVDLERLAFASVEAAREAACCVRCEQRSLTDVAIAARQPVRDTSERLERLDPALHDAVLSAGPGDLVGPIAVASRHEVVCVVAKKLPQLSDPTVHARAAEAVVEQMLTRAMQAHVCWEAPPRSGSAGRRQLVAGEIA